MLLQPVGVLVAADALIDDRALAEAAAALAAGGDVAAVALAHPLCGGAGRLG